MKITEPKVNGQGKTKGSSLLLAHLTKIELDTGLRLYDD